ncbi:substrate-binding domain-containing protein [Basfia succiniciproducens]|uniref:substrate-binding domain-containing protein n=1 Tax=Basfia succiniciproducens TaxID=653940 RepID=UPI0008AD7A39|nr:substrate-binding domain-containing protein [Basfia succiniciproducens]SEQ75259.1 transcriptional regulator, LacI family [Basfia succiniciproducens]
MATMKDIARLANVSTSTVSHVINNDRFVSEKIREKVMAVVKELNYQPSGLARSFKTKETKTIGMLVTASDNPFFAEVVHAVERYCCQQNYNLILSNTEGSPQHLQHNLQMLINKQVDGLLLMCSETHTQDNMPINLPIPAVIMDWWPSELTADKIFENSELGAYLATKHLIHHQHKRIAIVNGDLRKPIAQNRLIGYKKALTEANLPIDEALIFEGKFDFQTGFDALERLLKTDCPPSAIFACCDAIALGIYQAAWRHNLIIPRHLSVIGYDDTILSQYIAPPLSTIHQPKTELGKLAVQTLLERIKNPQKTYRTFVLDPVLVERESVATRKES